MGSDIGLAAIYRILKKSGAERISEESTDELRRILEDVALAISKSSVELAHHAGRRTVRADDVQLAAKAFINSGAWPRRP